MIDFARITVKAGDGGAGSGSFFRIKGKGAKGEDLVIKVPVGTQVKVTEVTEEPKEPNVKSQKPLARLAPLDRLSLFDLTEDGQRVLTARGGQGGRGNIHIKDEFGRRPKVGERGGVGEACKITLELKLIADIGIIGLPNAGKSTLLSALTAAKPKIAPYPFTTLEPNLGVLSVGQRVSESVNRKIGQPVGQRAGGSVDQKTEAPNHRHTESLILADIPGLIEGASRGRGLGDLFLRHIERTKILVHLIDASTDTDKWQDYQTVRGELKIYSKELLGKKEIIAFNKIDLVDQQIINNSILEFVRHRKKIIPISAVDGKGLEDLVKLIYGLIKIPS